MAEFALRIVAAGLIAATAWVGGAGGVQAADAPTDIDAKAAGWDQAAARLGTAGSLWEPRSTADLARTRQVRVLANALAFANARVIAGDTYAGTRYGRGARSLWLEEKWANTGWAAEPVVTTSRALVERVRIRLGEPGSRTTVTARIYAECVVQPPGRDPRPVPRRFRCTRADVLRTGGTLEMTARPASQMTAPGTTSVVMRSTGLTFRELRMIASSLQQVAGASGDGAGSAQMVAMCRQMVDATMTFEQADAFAQSNGYSARVGSIDGQPQAVTLDYRPDRFTVALVSGAVTACTYG